MKRDYEYIDIKKVLKKLNTSLNGLTNKEANRRLKEYGYNELPREKRKSVFKVFIESFMDPIIYVMIVAAILSFVANEPLDALAIIFIILVDAVMSTIQEYKATKNAEALKELIKVKAKVIRDNEYIEIDSSLLVPGDIIVLESGTKISADARIINSNNLTIDESILTGESIGVLKEEGEAILSDVSKKNMLYAGTSVLTGRALAVVCGTGLDTEVGKIAEKVTTTEESKSPLTIRTEKFSKQITMLIVIISIIIAIVLIYKKYEPIEIFLSVVALGVSAMPEGLPLSLTLALTIASNKMGKRNVIVKKLNSVESLGSCTVIASDKTGTLTVNEQTAKKVVLPNGEKFDIEGNGYNDVGKIIFDAGSELKNAKYLSILGLVNNEAMLEKNKGKWDKFGDSIDIAFLALSRKLKTNDTEFKKVDVIPYESLKKYSAVFFKMDDKMYCTAKGSVEVILDFCSYSMVDGVKKKIDKEKILKQNDELASSGYRVIALCSKEIKEKEKYDERDLDKLNFIGLVGFIDPVRKEATASVKECHNAGIKVLMITGDHALTAYAIASELNIATNRSEVCTGSDLDFYIDDNEKFDNFVKDKTVFARVTPIQKLKIVESLQRQGEFVAVTGDGVNDAPAIKVANIGVAMGSGTDVAKETAKMIIIDDNFSSIVAGIEEGRNAYSNIRKVCIMLLSCGFAEVLFFVLSIIFNLSIPLVAIQLLWLNLVTDGLQDMALSFEKETDTIMKEKPRKTTESLFEREMIIQILLSGLFIGVIVFAVWWFLVDVLNFEVAHARGYVLALMVFMQNVHVLNCRSESKSVFHNSFKTNPFILIVIVGTILLQMLVMEVPVLSSFLQTYDVPPMHLLLLFAMSLPVLFVMEVYKYIKRNKK